MREVRFRLSASKNFLKEKKMCLTHEFLDPFVSRVASECFFLSSFPLSLSYSLSSLSISTMMMIVVLARTTRKIFALGGHPPDHRVDDRFCESAIFKEERVKRESRRSCLACRFLVEKKKLFSFSPENVRFFRRVERSRERKRCLFL